MQWFIDDELAKSIIVTVFAPRPGMLAALIKFEINEGVRNYRFEFNDVTQVWRLAGEGL